MTESKQALKESVLNVVEFLGIACILYGLYLVVGLERVSGIWVAMLGIIMVRLAAEFATEHVIHKALAGHRVAEFVEPDDLALDPSMSLSQLMQPSRRSDQLVFPVARSVDHKLVGVVDVRNSTQFPPSEWSTHSVAEITKPCDLDMTVAPDADAETALLKMQTLGLKQMLVVRGGRLLGVLRQNTLIKQIQEGLTFAGPQRV